MYKPLADSTLHSMTKKKIIELLRTAEHNAKVSQEWVVHARWIPFHSEVAGDIQYCSACDIGNLAKSDFCPHCGAMMDGGADHEDD